MSVCLSAPRILETVCNDTCAHTHTHALTGGVLHHRQVINTYSQIYDLYTAGLYILVYCGLVNNNRFQQFAFADSL